MIELKEELRFLEQHNVNIDFAVDGHGTLKESEVVLVVSDYSSSSIPNFEFEMPEGWTLVRASSDFALGYICLTVRKVKPEPVADVGWLADASATVRDDNAWATMLDD